jgi:hypothetical protein
MGDVVQASEGSKEDVQESRRDRVRRVLFRPLGFRRPASMTAEDHAAQLDSLADELGYMAEEKLDVLRQMLQSKGQGKDRNVWPDRATVRGFAELVQPRPLAELPGLVRWFRSVEGPRAIAEGTLVETWAYFERHKAPPVSVGARARVIEEAQVNKRRLQVVDERIAAGFSVLPGETEWADWYRKRRAACEAAVAEMRGDAA